MKRCLLAIVALSANLFLIGCADDQARQQIADTNVRLSQVQQNVGVLGTKLSNQRLLDLLNKLDSLQSQVDQLNGSVATLKHNLQTYQSTQDQLYQSLQQQIQSLQRVAGQSPSDMAPKSDSSATISEGITSSGNNLKLALTRIKKHDFAGAIKELKAIIKTVNDPAVVASANYYLSVAYAANGQYQESITVARKFVAENPQSRNAPDALRTIYIAQNQLGMTKSAANTAKRLIKEYPGSAAAKKVQQELPTNSNS
ncbi:MAG: tetratricopeptide repeat protein [Burkholderiales bacterium]